MFVATSKLILMSIKESTHIGTDWLCYVYAHLDQFANTPCVFIQFHNFDLLGHLLAPCSWEWLLCHYRKPALYWTGCQWGWDSHHLLPSTVCVNFWTIKSGCHCKHVCLNCCSLLCYIGILTVEGTSTHQCSQHKAIAPMRQSQLHH